MLATDFQCLSPYVAPDTENRYLNSFGTVDLPAHARRARGRHLVLKVLNADVGGFLRGLVLLAHWQEVLQRICVAPGIRITPQAAP